MKNKNSLRPKAKTNLRLRKIVLYTAGASALIALFWKIFLGSAVTVVNPGQVFGMFTPSEGPQVTGYSWMKTITVNSAQVMDTVDLEDFPLLISITQPDLRSVSNGGFVQSEDGYDILFTGANEAQLDHQVESYDPTTGKYVAWVRLPVLYHDINTELNITCGNSSITSDQTSQNVWSDNHDAVWHMGDDPSSSLIDAAGTYNGQGYGGMNGNSVVPGKIGNAIEFDGWNDYIAIEGKNYTDWGEITQLTVSGWVNTTHFNNSWTANWSILDFDRSEYFNFFVHGDGRLSFCSRGAGTGIDDFHAGQPGQVNDGQWHHVVGVFDGNQKHLYIDGVLVATKTNPHNGAMMGTGATRYGFIGEGSEATTVNGSRNNRYYQGKIDELRLLNIELSAGWIATEYNNQSSPETFYTVGDPYNLPIELIAFNAKLNGDNVAVDWSTATQRNNDYFSIERSIDGKQFEVVGEVDGAGDALYQLDYDFIDPDPIEGLSYYRLRQTDFDGATETFLPVAINYVRPVDKVTIKRVYPNPFANTFTFDYSLSTSSQVEIALLNTNGQQVFSDQIYADEGSNTYTYYASGDLQPGIYMLSILQDGELLASSKLMKR